MNCKEEDWELTIQVNLKGVWLSMKYEIAQMLKQSGGAIVNTSSAYGWPPTEVHQPTLRVSMASLA